MSKDKISKIAVIGAGSWGTALAMALGQAGWQVRLWARRAEIAGAIQRDRRNPQYLSEFALPAEAQAQAGDTASSAFLESSAGQACVAWPPYITMAGGSRVRGGVGPVGSWTLATLGYFH